MSLHLPLSAGHVKCFLQFRSALRLYIVSGRPVGGQHVQRTDRTCTISRGAAVANELYMLRVEHNIA